MNEQTKKCIKCNKIKPLSEFYFRKDTGKYRNTCKECKNKPLPPKENDILLKDNKRRCKICNKIKDISEFYFRKEQNRYRTECKSCLLNQQKDERAKKPKKPKEIKLEPQYYVCKCCKKEKPINDFREIKPFNNNIPRHVRTCYECEKKKNHDRYMEKLLKDPVRKLKYEIEQENKILEKENKRKCNICLKIKPLSEYYYRKDTKQYRGWCIECEKQRTKTFYEGNKEEILEKQHQSYRENREVLLERKKEYAKSHKEQLRKYHTKYAHNRRRDDDIFRFKSQIRHLINQSFRRRGLQKRGKTEQIVGLDFDTFTSYLLKTYKDNYGYEWDGKEPVHIDHIIPLATAKTEKEILELCNYKNLQLLKEKDNLDKKDKLDYEIKRED